MDSPERYPPSVVLRNIADRLESNHSDLRVSLSSNHTSYEKALEATLDCVRGLSGRILLPTTKTKLDNQRILEKMVLEIVDTGETSHPMSSSTQSTDEPSFSDRIKNPNPRRVRLKRHADEDTVPPERPTAPN
ncbi:hypothetical protein N7466_006393 [Penicillium verhagenii]|uniref:uncharacterized protein n=1 Tax=Penicillium verhagenii TaxID=1562060 RepID=UPI0025457D3A|nr:uncharacterized protein N7466_006393 [Penicillium verhagenii]KAJ5930900.1 hypothetical protein N7466_006393 [Penicillium verhagenii]